MTASIATVSIERSTEFEEILQHLHHGEGFTFITGPAGTGKSTLLRMFLQETPLYVPVIAPTGVAALNVNGQTIHRFFGFPPSINAERAKMEARFRKQKGIYRKIEVLIIDEISMVRADLFDAMDVFLRAVRKDKRPFGGVRVIAFGDLFQLPPIVSPRDKEQFTLQYPTPYFFSSGVMETILSTGGWRSFALKKIYRQNDEAFLSILSGIRHHRLQQEQLKILNTRTKRDLGEQAIVLTTRNIDADVINQRQLESLPGKACVIEGSVHGEFPLNELPTEQVLTLKKGARVMCVANDPQFRFVNGSLGWVESFDEDAKQNRIIIVRLDDGTKVALSAHTWSVQEHHYQAETDEYEPVVLGSYSQIPLKLAWAVTIHKSQGKTFDHVVVDLGLGAFAPGQAYVALSRCRSLEGLSLRRPLLLSDIRVDPNVVEFVEIHRL